MFFFFKRSFLSYTFLSFSLKRLPARLEDSVAALLNVMLINDCGLLVVDVVVAVVIVLEAELADVVADAVAGNVRVGFVGTLNGYGFDAAKPIRFFSISNSV